MEQAVGNPGLQHWLTKVAHETPERITDVLHQVKTWRTQGTYPTDEELHAKVTQLSLQTLHDQLSPAEQALLRTSQMWPSPLPAVALTELAKQHDLDIQQAGATLSGMSLWQDHRTAKAPEPTWSLNRLAESVLQPLTEAEQQTIAQTILPALKQCWSEPDHTQSHTLLSLAPVSYTHLTLPTNREV